MKNQDLKKIMSAKDVIVVAFGAMIGWGWVVSSGEWIQKAGVIGTVLGFILGGIMIFFVGLTYSELTTAMPECGGEHIFSYKALGKGGSFICTWFLILSYIGVVCFEACSLPTILQYIFPGFLQVYLYTIAGFDVYLTWLLVAILFAIVITYINIRGIKAAAILQTILTLVIAFVGILLVVFSAINGETSNLNGQLFEGSNFLGSTKNIFAIATIAPFFLFGFDVIPQAAEEINVPLKKIGKLMLLSIILAVVFYALVVIAVGYSMSSKDINDSLNTSGLVTADAMAKVFNSSIMAKVLIIGGLCGIVTSWNSFLLGGSRAIYSMSKSKMIPNIFSKISKKYNTPINALLFVGLLSIIAPFFGRSMLNWIANTASFSCCIAYCIVAISFMILRKKEPDLDRPYKVKHYKFVGIMAIFLSGLMIAMYLIPNTGSTFNLQEWIIILLWVIFGLIMWFVNTFKKRKENDKNNNTEIG